VAALCDRVGVLREGHLVAVESVSDLRSRGGKQVRVRVAEDVDRDDFEVRGIMNLRVGETVSFTWTGEYDALLDLLSGYTVLDLDVVDAPLEEAFMTFYDGDVPGPTGSGGSGGGGRRGGTSGGDDRGRAGDAQTDATAESGGESR
jgi:ABC-2 type transport system ATP-binding protein